MINHRILLPINFNLHTLAVKTADDMITGIMYFVNNPILNAIGK